MPESVWEYPRPPRVEPSGRRVRVLLGGAVIADTTRAHRVLETSHPPVYLPREDVTPGSLEPSREGATFCEWKGVASYLDAIQRGRPPGSARSLDVPRSVAGFRGDPRRGRLLAGLYFGPGFSPEAALAIGLPLGLSSTAQVLPMLRSDNELNTPQGERAFSILLFQDLVDRADDHDHRRDGARAARTRARRSAGGWRSTPCSR